MLKSFAEIEARVLSSGVKGRLAVACAHDDHVLDAVIAAKKNGLVSATLIGDTKEIANILADLGEDIDDYTLIECADELEAGRIAVGLVKSGEADIPMKGLMQTSSFVKAILNKENGLMLPGGLLSYASLFEHDGRLTVFTDAAINIAPSLEDKINIIKNARRLTKVLGMDTPKVAIISAVEKVSHKMISTLDAQAIAEAGVEGFIVEGPLALDGAISPNSAAHKGIDSPVAGHADILLLPDICAGNVLYKSLTYIAGKTVASVVCGASVPVVITSRSDTPESKYYSILMALLQCI